MDAATPFVANFCLRKYRPKFTIIFSKTKNNLVMSERKILHQCKYSSDFILPAHLDITFFLKSYLTLRKYHHENRNTSLRKRLVR